MKNRVRIVAAVLLSVAMLFGTAYVAPVVKAAEETPEKEPKGITVWGGSAIVTNTAGQAIKQAMPGDIVIVTLDMSYIGATESFTGWDIFDGSNNQVALTGAVTDHQVRFVMPDNTVNINAKKATDPAKVESSKKASSEAESRSKAEEEAAKKSKEESEAASKSASESESRSEAESKSIEESKKAAEESSRVAAETIRVGSYDMYLHVSGTSAPEGFTASQDNDSFEKPVECFYSSKFKTYAYYAKKNAENNYYIYNKMTDDLFPFVTFTGAGGVNYLVIAPESENDLPDEVTRVTSVNLGTVTSVNNMVVPAWNAEDREGTERTLLYLASDDGTRQFFVYESKSGAVKLTEWEKFNEEETETTEETSEETTEEETTEETTVVVTTEAPEKKGGLFKNYVIWLVIIGVIIVLLVVAIVVVFYMGKKQDAEEAALDDDDEDPTDPADSDDGDGFITGNVEDDFQAYDSSYSRPEQDDLEPFDINFEDAFPDEMGFKNPDVEEIQVEVKPTHSKLNGTFGGAAAEPLKPEDSFSDTELDEFLSEDDFEVIDFSKK